MAAWLYHRRMPEELNRVVVDHVSTLLFAPDQAACDNLRAEGRAEAQICLVGSSSIDAVQRNQAFAATARILERMELLPHDYLVLTLHRAENTLPDQLPGILQALNQLADSYQIVFPVHPRTAAAIAQQGLQLAPNMRTCQPLGYLDMLKLVSNARALLTDSGGLQEESAVLGVPALLLRNETEWRYLVDAGVNVLIGTSFAAIRDGTREWLAPAALAKLQAARTPLWPGASERVAARIAAYAG